MSTTLINIVPPGTICKKIFKKLRYFRLLPNLAQRIFIDLANHLPSFTPNKVLVTEKQFFQFLSNMASARKRSHAESFDAEEALRRILEEESDHEGIPSGEESDLDRELYDVERELR